MKIILLQSYEKLGKVGEIINVKPGFARNYLIPNKIASLATEQNIKALEVLDKFTLFRPLYFLKIVDNRARTGNNCKCGHRTVFHSALRL